MGQNHQYTFTQNALDTFWFFCVNLNFVDNFSPLLFCHKSAKEQIEILLILVLAKLQHLLIWHLTGPPTVELLSQEQLVSKGMGEVQGEHLWILLLPLCYFSLISIPLIIWPVIAACVQLHKMTKYLQLHEADSSEREESARHIRHWESSLKWCPCRQVLFVTFFFIFRKFFL